MRNVGSRAASTHSKPGMPSERSGRQRAMGQRDSHRPGNLSAHKTKAVEQFLEEQPKVRFHFTLTYSSWLNQVELWFAKIQRDLLARGIFTSVQDLARKICKYIRAYAKLARPFRWSYSDPTRRIVANPIAGTAH
jgi:transposase